MTRLLLRGGCVLTLGAKTPNLVTGDVLIDGSTIAEVGTNLRARDAETIDAGDTIVMPGFVDAHRHLWRSLFRNAGADGRPDPLSLHAGLPVTKGTKHLASRWIRAGKFTYPPPKPILDL